MLNIELIVHLDHIESLFDSFNLAIKLLEVRQISSPHPNHKVWISLVPPLLVLPISRSIVEVVVSIVLPSQIA